MEETDDDIQDTVKKKTYSVFLNPDRYINNIFKYMAGISKNVYNTTVYIYSIFIKYKSEIFKTLFDELNSRKKKQNFNIDIRLHDLLLYFYTLHSDTNSKIKKKQ
jgi:hypothetical protein